MSLFTKSQAVVRSSALGLLVLTGAVTVDFLDAPASIIRQQPETVQATKVSLVSLRASLQNPAEALRNGPAFFDLEAPGN